ncbi:MAG: methyltransferase domain-containing protein [Planctomycetaceae bacterium]|nr:methyltransferase domain-containing protein [Planctomycetales bacterium]MCB9920683.1 methyltransferase domain-containing protein [Planctomycetaceae bacterium]
MPDQIDLSLMDSIPIVPNGFLRLRRHWKAPTDGFWDQIWDGTSAKDYWKDALEGRLTRDYETLFKNYVKKGAKVLEAGCGVGQVVLALRARGYDCWGLDYAEKTINSLTDIFPDTPFVHGDIRELPFEDESFDVYVSLGVIEHFTSGQSQILAEAARVLRPNGVILISVPALNSYRKMRIRYKTYREKSALPFFEDCYSREELESLLEDAGFHCKHHTYLNTPMTAMQESPFRRLYRLVEDRRRFRGPIDRCLRWTLPKSWFGHMLMVVGEKKS